MIETRQIYDFLETQVNASEPTVQEELKLIKTRILALSRGRVGDEHHGIDYNNNALTPDQHIRRRINPDWREGNQTISKFYVDHLDQAVRGSRQASEPSARRQRNTTKYWSPYDLLGLFLSRLGHAQSGADENNFFLPLTAVYSLWCSRIAGSTSEGVGDPPAMFQCTWVEHRQGTKQFFLGASLGGYNWAIDSTGTWERELKMARFNLVQDLLISTDRGWQWTIDASRTRDPRNKKDKKKKTPNKILLEVSADIDCFVQENGQPADNMQGDVRNRLETIILGLSTFLTGYRENDQRESAELPRAIRGFLEALQSRQNTLNAFEILRAKIDEVLWNRNGTRFGNCAETYPFVNLLQPDLVRPPNSTPKGFALARKHFWPPPDLQNPNSNTPPYNADTIAKYLKPPCNNCKVLLDALGIKKWRDFDVFAQPVMASS
ncbi:uncharacterized protein TRUGW13939_11215 [Talaromyces rugulosus]|uniref:Uncharacterized protein n=1 Tax=Talaromyces rugulosus TaxID=121627 RepID=A0A7H8RC72_TALRU|nr:uncharacterized protein TRUGW13939_11215 [Talaromyces rugulosus]QKX64042.1 hypothetical protein TRUGW13939_11215 [Talaromyces rugulosus]